MMNGLYRRSLTAWETLLCCFVLGVFANMFLFSWHLPWQSKYQLFGVPAFALPGIDSRNIQVASHCATHGDRYSSVVECEKSASPVRSLYPRAVVPPLNYPSLWVKAYASFKDDSEGFFLLWWSLNALLLAGGLFLCCVRYNALALPIFLFSPISLLAVERGNVDAAVFFVTYVPLFALSRSAALQSFFIGIASALKIFPIVGYLAFVRLRPPFLSRAVLAGALVAAPLVVRSFREIPNLFSGTTQGFGVAYGLASLQYAPVFKERGDVAMLVIAAVVLVGSLALGLLLGDRRMRELVDDEFGRFDTTDLRIFVVSAAIFVATFLLMSNWAYRLIFVIPAALILSQAKAGIFRLAWINVLVIFWVPLLPHGWRLQNLACIPLAVVLSYLLIRAVANSPGKESAADAVGRLTNQRNTKIE